MALFVETQSGQKLEAELSHDDVTDAAIVDCLNDPTGWLVCSADDGQRIYVRASTIVAFWKR